jgi:hypothetical protein
MPTTTTPTATPSASASPSASPLDPAAAAAIAALDEFFAAINSAARGGSVKDVERLSSPSCQVCASLVDDLSAAQRDGVVADRDRFARWQATPERVQRDDVIVRTVVEFAAVNLLDKSGQQVEEIPRADSRTFVWTVRKQPGGTWLIIQGTGL